MTLLSEQQKYQRRCGGCGVMRMPHEGKCRSCGSNLLQADNLRGLPTDVLSAALAVKDRWGNPTTKRVEHEDVIYRLRPWPIVYELLDRLDKESPP